MRIQLLKKKSDNAATSSKHFPGISCATNVLDYEFKNIANIIYALKLITTRYSFDNVKGTVFTVIYIHIQHRNS